MGRFRVDPVIGCALVYAPLPVHDPAPPGVAAVEAQVLRDGPGGEPPLELPLIAG